MLEYFRSIVGLFFDLLVPPRESEIFVRALSIEALQALLSPAEAGLLPYRERAVTALVWEVKYHANPRAAKLAGEILAEELSALAAEELGRPLLIPIPMHAARRRERGHNQTELLCEAALKILSGGKTSQRKTSDETGLRKVLGSPPPPRRGRPDFSSTSFVSSDFDYAPDILARTINTPPQQRLPKHRRLNNVRGSMRVIHSERVKGRVCIVVDDVATTGATLKEAKRALREAGARKVITLALAYS